MRNWGLIILADHPFFSTKINKRGMGGWLTTIPTWTPFPSVRACTIVLRTFWKLKPQNLNWLFSIILRKYESMGGNMLVVLCTVGCGGSNTEMFRKSRLRKILLSHRCRCRCILCQPQTVSWHRKRFLQISEIQNSKQIWEDHYIRTSPRTVHFLALALASLLAIRFP